MSEKNVHFVKKQYEQWPYPQIPWMAQVRPESLWQINYEWVAQTLGKPASSHPRIWIAGCGTFQPYVFSQANPKASILATDLSESSLKKAENRCALYRRKNVEFRTLDLSKSAAFPNEKFDWIECYGVLMCLPNPEEVLREFGARLNPNGILRLMVYPHYGRQRIFQVQKIAKLLGLGPEEEPHPKVLKRLMSVLPENHPLKSAFFDYPDSNNLPGIVDGFLHASDRGFTGEEISKMLDQSGFDLGFCYHRPWGQPEGMAQKLRLEGFDPAFWLHYLDLWQSLKSNFILTLVKKNSPSFSSEKVSSKHTLFDWEEPLGLKHRLRMIKKSLIGGKVQSRTHEEGFLKLSAAEYRNLLRGRTETSQSAEILGRNRKVPKSFFSKSGSFPKPSDPWKVQIGKTPNPIYRHLFDAYTFSRDFVGQGGVLPTLKEEIARWAEHSRPLETEDHPWGLTPCATYQENGAMIEDWLSKKAVQREVPISEAKLTHEKEKISELLTFLSQISGVKVPKTEVELRILWILLMSHDQLFLEFEL